jgi:hypothetical protein
MLMIFILIPSADAHWHLKPFKHCKKETHNKPKKPEYLDRMWRSNYHQVYNWETKKWEDDNER